MGYLNDLERYGELLAKYWWVVLGVIIILGIYLILLAMTGLATIKPTGQLFAP